MNTKHIETCRRVFGRYDLECPRCRELAHGAPARHGWGRHGWGYPTTFQASDYCFCPGTSLAAHRCPTCGKPPYTD